MGGGDDWPRMTVARGGKTNKIKIKQNDIG